MKKVLSLMMMTLLCVAAWAGEVTDVITVADLGNSGKSAYVTWTDKSFTSDAVYAGMTSGGNGDNNACIQLRSNGDNSGIVTTTSGGKIKSVTLTFNAQQDGTTRSVKVYGKNTAYTAASNLYDRSTYGTELGSISSSETTSKTLTVEGDYEYIGLRSNSGAIYLDKIEIVWTVEDTPAEPEFVFTPAAGTYTAAQNVAISVNNKPENCFMQVRFVGESEVDWMRAESYNVTESGDLYARLISSEDYETVIATSAAQTYTINIPEPATITFSPAAGEVEAGTQVTISAANVPAGMKLFTCKDNDSWSKYITSYTINAASTLRAAILDENTDDTEINWYTINGTKAEASYTIKVTPVADPKIVFSVEAGEVEAGTQVTVSAEDVDYDYIIKATYNDEEKEGQTVTFTLNETGSVLATIWKWSASMDDYVQTNISGSARYTVVAPEPDPVITITPNGGTFENEQLVMVTVENMPNDASIYYDFEADDAANSIFGMMLQGGQYNVTESGYLVVRVVREAADEAPMKKAPKTGTLAELRSEYFQIEHNATGIEALTAGKAVKGIRYFNVAGQQAAAAFQGVNIVVVDYQDGTQAVTKVVK